MARFPRAVTPLSHDPPLRPGDEFQRPSEPKETPVGRLLYVLDQGTHSIYEYDTGRDRFLGPANRVAPAPGAALDGPAWLPGYPTPVSKQPPQAIATTKDWVFVAGGLDAVLVAVPVEAGRGLGEPKFIDIPPAEFPGPDGRPVRNTGRHSPVDALLVSPIGDGLALVITRDGVGMGSTQYLVDLAAGKVLGSAQLADRGEYPRSAAAWRSSVVTIGGSGTDALLIGPDLSARRLPLPGGPYLYLVSVVDDIAVFQATPPGRGQLVALDLNSGATRVLHENPGQNFASGLLATRTGVWWANLGPDDPKVATSRRLPDVLTHVVVADLRDFSAPVRVEKLDVGHCQEIVSMVEQGDSVYALCKDNLELARIPLDGRPPVFNYAGLFPDTVVAAQ